MDADSGQSGRLMRRVAAACAVAVGGLSLVYAVFYLFVAPSAQRGTDAGAAYASYLAHPLGLRVAALCLAVSGVLTSVVFVSLRGLPGALSAPASLWAAVIGAIAGVATSAHGLSDLITQGRLAHAYASQSPATQQAVLLVRQVPSPTDPRGLATFGLAGLAVLVLSRHVRPRSPGAALLGTVLGVDMVALFAATVVGSSVPILVTGGLASVVLGPAWWVWIAVLLRRSGRLAVAAS
jgi:hypothetical protein